MKDETINSLSGILVVSIEQAVAAPLCTARLVDAGARVIKIERREGDFARKYDSDVKGESSYFTWLNQGKESVVLDFKKNVDHKILLSIIRKADIYVQNLKPGVLNKYKLDSESISQLNPKIITCDISGYGENGLANDYKSYDLLVQAESGLIGVSGSPKEFGRIGVSICDIGAGITSYTAILEGLVRKYRGFGGSSYKTSLFSVASEWMTVPLAQYEYGEKEIGPVGLKHPSIAPYGAFYTRDNQLILISIQNEREWNIFVKEIIKNKNILVDERFSNNELRVKNRVALDHCIQEKFKMLDFEPLKKELHLKAIAFAGINSLKELTNHFALNRQEMKTSNGQIVSFPGRPFERVAAKKTILKKDLRAPRLGEHTEKIKNEFFS